MLRENLLLLTLFFFSFPAFSQFTVTMDGTNPTCPGYTTGMVTCTPNGGVGPYYYIWDNFLSGQSLIGVGAGTYTVTATDSNGDTGVGTFTLTDPDDIQFDIQINDICAGDGNVTGSASGGTPPYSYAWDDGQTGQNATGLTPGQHCGTVTDANGCMTATCTIIYAELTVDVLTSDLNCFTDCDASVTAVVLGGFGPYSFLWNVGATTQILENQPAGFYSVTVTDANGCTAVGSNSIGSPTSLDVSVSVTNPLCGSGGTGTATVTATGGIPPYNYWWSTGETTTTITNLPPGDYQVVVTDAHGCQTADGFTIVEDGGIELELEVTPTSGCSTVDGTASVTVIGGTPPYVYEWDNGSPNTTITNLAPGDYGVTVTDANDCNVVGTAMVGGAPDVDVMLTAGDVTCASGTDGWASAVGFAGTPPYTYAWNNGVTSPVNPNLPPGDYTVTVTDSNACIIVGTVTVGGSPLLEIMSSGFDPSCPGDTDGSVNAVAMGGNPPYDILWSNGATTSTVSGLGAGTYNVVITDSDGCTASATVSLTDPDPIAISADVNNDSCPGMNNGGVDLTVSGGTPPYSYQWSNGQTTQDLTMVSAGTYSVTVKDSEGCEETYSATIEYDSQIDIVTTSEPSCEGSATGSAKATVSGGIAPYTFSWSNGGDGSSILDVAAGTYSVTVTDDQGCEKTASVTVDEVGTPTCTATVTSVISTAGGSDGEATANVSGGTAPYSYLWSDGQTGQTATGLSAGTHSVTVTDDNGCSSVCEVTLEDPAKLGDYVWLDENQNGCQDGNEIGIFNVEVHLTGTDVDGNPVNLTTTTNPQGIYTFDGLPDGEYQVFVTDLPHGLIFTSQNACGDNSVDSDVNPTNGYSATISLVSGDCYLDLDIGFYSKCDNITDPGEIEGDEVLCGPGNDAGPITEVEAPSGGSGALEIVWMYSTDGPPFNPATWTLIPGATGNEYDPGVLYETTYFARCARRECCNTYLETNIVVKTVDDVAVAEIHGSDLVCVGDVVTYEATDGGPTATYAWDFGSTADPQTSDQQTVNVVFDSYGVITIYLEVENNGCLSSTSMEVFVTDSPPLCGNPIIINADPMQDGEVKIAWAMSAVPGDWDFTIHRSKDGINFGEIGSFPQTQSSGIVEYQYMDKNPERGTSYYKVTVKDETGIYYAESNMVAASVFTYQNRFMVYPNPFDNQLRIDIDESVSTEVQLEIYSPLGHLVSSELIDNQSVQHNITLDELSEGLYFVRLSFGNNQEEVFRVLKR